MQVSDMEGGVPISAETLRWMKLVERFSSTLPGTGFVIMDANERVIKRVDHPRVPGIPTLQYQAPDVQTENWSMFDKDMADRAVHELDRVHVTFAPHRVLHVRELVEERLAASRQRDYIAALATAEDAADDEAITFRP